ncbi:hypothetical protein HDU97_000057 [Phlyctochytrium planicorne]|nr:hypothetical protein HDU97_000057 [Phlyctochytrium planicorne]
MDSSSGSVLSQLQHQIGELHADPVLNGHEDSYNAADEDSVANGDEVLSPVETAPVKNSIDLASEELFPALMSTNVGKPLPAWRAPPVIASPKTNGASVVKKGKVSERLEIPSNLQAKLPQNGKGSVWDFIKIISLKTQTTIDYSTHRTTNTMTFLISGKPEAVKQARRELVSSVGAQVTETLHVPASVRPHILGAGGKNLKALTAETNTRVNIPRPANQDVAKEPSADPFDDDDNQVVTIIGDFEGVKVAKERIESEVAKRTSKLNLRVNIDRSFHPFIAGPNNTNVQRLENELGAKIHIPPPGPISADKSANEIIIIGDREAVKKAEEELKSLTETLKRTTRTLSFPVKKRQHRFIIGPKGATLQEILLATGCSVELPPPTDASDVVTVRGPDNMLSNALQAVLQKSNEILLEELEVADYLPASTEPKLFLRYLFTKERSELKKIETNHNVSLFQPQLSNGAYILEIQGKTRPEVDAARKETLDLLKEWGAVLFFGEVEIPRGLHRFVVGKQGQNITKMKASAAWEGRLVDVVVPNESEESDDVLLVVKRLKPLANVKAVPKKGENPDAEVSAFAEKVRQEIISVANAQADFTTEIVPVPVKFHGRLIGSGGEKLKELLAPYNNNVSIKFPSVPKGKESEEKDKKKPDIDPNSVVIKGPKKEVADLKAKVERLASDFKHIETLASYTETLKVGKGLGKKILSGVGAAGPSGSGDRASSTIGWLVRLVKETLTTAAATAKTKAGTTELSPEQAVLHLKVEVNNTDDGLVISGPKNAVLEAKAVLTDRAARLVDQVTVDVKVFEEVSKEAQKVLKETEIADLKRRILRRLIGKEGKVVKNTMEKYAVYIQFPDRKRSRRKDDDDEEEVEIDEGDAADNEGLVIIKGNKKDVAAAKTEILATVESEILKSFVLTFEIPKNVLPHIVGSQGARINKLKDECGIRVDFDDIEDNTTEVKVVLEGSRAGCLDAQKKIQEAVDDLVNVGNVDLPIPSYLHKDIIGPSGSRIKTVIDSFGGPEKVKVQFPPRGDGAIPGVDPNIVTLKAHTRDIAKLRKAIEKLAAEVIGTEEKPISLINESEAIAESETQIPKSEISRIMGKGGDHIKDLIRKYHVNIWVTGEEEEGIDVTVRVVAKKSDEANVKKVIDEVKGKIRVSEQVAIPEKVLASLAAGGATRDAELASINDILRKVRAESSGGAYAEIQGPASRGQQGSSITVRGDAKAIKAAVALVTKSLNELILYDSTVRVSIEPHIRPHVIGRAGATINRIRADTGASIDIVRGSEGKGKSDATQNDTVVIRGTAAAVESAQTAINKIVEEQKTRFGKERERESTPRSAAAALLSPAVSSGSIGAARIDDDAYSDAGSSIADGGVPGYSGKAPQQAGRRKKRGDRSLASSLVTGVPAPSTSYYASFTSAPKEDTWQDVKKKGKKEEETAVAAATAATTVVGAGETSAEGAKKKKNKKKKSDASGDAEPSESSEFVHVVTAPEPKAPTPASEPKAPTPASAPVVPVAVPVSAPAETKKTAKAKQAPIQSTIATSPVQGTPTPAPTPAVANAPYNAVLDDAVFEEIETAQADDGWTTVSTVKKFKQNKLAEEVSDAAPAAPASAEGAPKKKKNKKKKKKTSTAAATEGADEESGDE